jgi:hypothetical protein
VPDRPEPAPDDPDEKQEDQASEALNLKNSFGTAIGAAMLGLEQALRDEPPPQVQAAEHMPDQRRVPGNDDLELHFPELPHTPDEA